MSQLTTSQEMLLRHMGAGYPLWRRPSGSGACSGFRYTAEDLDPLEGRGLIQPFGERVGPWVLTTAARAAWCERQNVLVRT